jgi:di-N-acetylchitobiase
VDPIPTGLICKAHANGVKVAGLMPYPAAQLHNESYLEAFIAQQITLARTYYLDGGNFDFESPLNTTEDAAALTNVVNRTTVALKAAIGDFFVVSQDVAWSPNCIDGRCFEYAKLAAIVDQVRAAIIRGGIWCSSFDAFDFCATYRHFLSLYCCRRSYS